MVGTINVASFGGLPLARRFVGAESSSMKLTDGPLDHSSALSLCVVVLVSGRCQAIRAMPGHILKVAGQSKRLVQALSGLQQSQDAHT